MINAKVSYKVVSSFITIRISHKTRQMNVTAGPERSRVTSERGDHALLRSVRCLSESELKSTEAFAVTFTEECTNIYRFEVTSDDILY